MKKWISLSILGTFTSLVVLFVIVLSQLTQLVKYDIFDIDSTDEELF